MKATRKNQVYPQTSANIRGRKTAVPCQPEVPFDTGDAVLRVMTKHLPAAVEPAPSPADGVQDTLKKLGELSEMGKALTFDALLGLSATLVRRVQEECPRIKLKTPKDLLNMTTALEMVNRQIHDFRGLEISDQTDRQQAPPLINLPSFKVREP